MKSLVWFITGASRGFGLEIARAAFERGDAVVAAARDPKVVESALGQRDKLLAVELDVTDELQAQASVRTALARFGQIDVLVNNAGRGLLGAVEEASAEEVRSVFAVNVDGLLTVTRADILLISLFLYRKVGWITLERILSILCWLAELLSVVMAYLQLVPRLPATKTPSVVATTMSPP